MAFYKNLSLLSGFAGLGLGYSLGNQNRSHLFLTLPLLGWQILFMTAMRYGLSRDQMATLYVLPFREQLDMGVPHAAHIYYGLETYRVLTVAFLLIALAFVPIAQVWGSVMRRRSRLTGSGLNLVSLAGVLLMFLVSAFWTPPARARLKPA